MTESDRLVLVANMAASYLRRNAISIDRIAAVVMSVADALERASKRIGAEPAGSRDARLAVKAELRPAVPVRQSVQGAFVVCLEDGFRAKALKRHLRSAHGMTPQQ